MKVERKNTNRESLTQPRVKLLIVLFFTILAAAIFTNCGQQNKTQTNPAITVSDQPDEIAPILAKNHSDSASYANFKHTIKEHADIQCNSCHERTDNAAAPKYAGHSSCINCHFEQFVTENSQMCAICHSDVKSAPAPVKASISKPRFCPNEQTCRHQYDS